MYSDSPRGYERNDFGKLSAIVPELPENIRVHLENGGQIMVRHGFSSANNDAAGNLAFGNTDAGLEQLGLDQAKVFREKVTAACGIEVLEVPVATSTLRRTRESAIATGFTALTAYSSLDEIAQHAIQKIKDIRADLENGILPDIALAKAEELIESPDRPHEQFLFMHGLLMAGCERITGVSSNKRLLPRFFEARILKK